MADNTQTAVRLPFFNKLFFASDHIGLQAIQYFRQGWVLFFLAPRLWRVLQGPGRITGWLNMDARVLAGFLISLAGLSTRLPTRSSAGGATAPQPLGQAHSFILFSTPFYALFAALIWFLPTEDASWWNALYFVICWSSFLLRRRCPAAPLEALVPEVTTTADDRMNLVGLIFLFAISAPA